ncbi:MAG: hypothetical protein ACXVWU_06595 [Nocardioides sp.]
MSSDQTLAESTTCPDCGSALNFRIEGFRPATAEERRRLTPHTIRVLGLCTNDGCPGREIAFPQQRSPR